MKSQFKQIVPFVINLRGSQLDSKQVRVFLVYLKVSRNWKQYIILSIETEFWGGDILRRTMGGLWDPSYLHDLGLFLHPSQNQVLSYVLPPSSMILELTFVNPGTQYGRLHIFRWTLWKRGGLAEDRQPCFDPKMGDRKTTFGGRRTCSRSRCGSRTLAIVRRGEVWIPLRRRRQERLHAYLPSSPTLENRVLNAWSPRRIGRCVTPWRD